MEWYERNKKPLPSWVEDEPATSLGDVFYLRAFSELSTCRQFGEVTGPIPWDRIYLYGSRFRLDYAMMNVFERVIRELDEAWLGWQREEQATRHRQMKK